MFKKQWDCGSLSGVFLEANLNELLCLITDLYSCRELYFILNDLDKITLGGDVEGNSSKEKFIRQYPNTPYINLVIVVFSL
jgi:hypothetical protein